MKAIIQFPHPGSEHTAKTGQEWNTGSHHRKYMKVNGDYLETLNLKPKKDNVYFWGEWEAQSKILYSADNENPCFPKNIFTT